MKQGTIRMNIYEGLAPRKLGEMGGVHVNSVIKGELKKNLKTKKTKVIADSNFQGAGNMRTGLKKEGSRFPPGWGAPAF